MTFDMDAFRASVLDDPLVRDIWDQKYRFKKPDGSSDEATVADTRRRVVRGVYAKDPDAAAQAKALDLVLRGILIPAGRINAGAGTGRRVTQTNCFVMETVMDSLPGIQRAISNAALTMQQGGGIGIDFSTIRPKGAVVIRTGSVSDGILTFADQMDAMCSTIASAGSRRGAMMLTLRDDHPDLWNPDQNEIDPKTRKLLHPSFISAKRQPGRLTQFNVSVLVSATFMDAVANDAEWDLGFHTPPADSSMIVDVYDKPFPYDYHEIDNDFSVAVLPRWKKGDMHPWYVYRRVAARRIWNDILRSTYVYAEPGVVFIDRMNDRNNLYFCEEIRSTNPCGEQALPPHGACNLGSVNLAFLVDEPFTKKPVFQFDTLKTAVRCGIRMLDNVIDVSSFPLTQQKQESDRKRRIGLGITGLADAMIQLGVRYGSAASIAFTRKVMSILRDESYRASTELAQERGSFPLFDPVKFSHGYNVRRLPGSIINQIVVHGIRNGVLNTIAPNGTISLYTGNVSSGHEPVFSFEKTNRFVRQADNSRKEYQSVPYVYRLWEAMHGPTPREKLPDYFVGANDLSVEDHLAIHATCQEYVDASISKTINCATSMTFEDFAKVYDRAYELGCKGVTTYRYDPTSGRGAVLIEADKGEPEKKLTRDDIFNVRFRPTIVDGRTYKLKWPAAKSAFYVTINRDGDGRPVELFVNSRDPQHVEWIAALTRMISAVFRTEADPSFVVHELEQVHAVTGGYFIDGRFCPSLPALIGRTIGQEFERLGFGIGNGDAVAAEEVSSEVIVNAGDCPECFVGTLIREQGCERCALCGFNRCG